MPRTKLLICFVFLFGLARRAEPQTTYASITGTVTDSTGAAVPNAVVTATNIQTNIKNTARTNEGGNYTIAQLKEGTYQVRAEAAGFKAFVIENIGLVARDLRRAD